MTPANYTLVDTVLDLMLCLSIVVVVGFPAFCIWVHLHFRRKPGKTESLPPIRNSSSSPWSD